MMTLRPRHGEDLAANVDREAMATFSDVLFGYAEGFVPIRIFAEKGGPDVRPVTRFVPADERLGEALLDAAVTADDRRAALYVIPGTVAEARRAAAADVVQLTTVLVDLDEGDIGQSRAHLVRHLGEPSLEVASGGRTAEGQSKLHLYWRLTEAAMGDDLQLVCRLRGEVAARCGGDVHFASAHQPIRVAGSVYGKGGVRRPVRIVARRPREVDLRDLADAVAAMPALPGLPVRPEERGLGQEPNAQALLTRRIREGGVDATTRFRAMSKVAGYWIRRAREGHCTLEHAREEVLGHNLARLDPPWNAARLEREFQRLLRLDQRNHGPWRETSGEESAAAGQSQAVAPPPLSEDALARIFTGRHGHDWKHVSVWGAWLGWDGARWRIDDLGRHREFVRQVCREAAGAVDAPRDAQRLASRKTISAVEHIARADPRHAARAVDWDARPMLLNTPGGILDLARERRSGAFGRSGSHEPTDHNL